MKIIFLDIKEDFLGWYPHIIYNFEIEYDTEKNFEIYTKGLRLNLKHQFYHNKVRRVRLRSKI